jgi:hypothetical protein
LLPLSRFDRFENERWGCLCDRQLVVGGKKKWLPHRE